MRRTEFTRLKEYEYDDPNMDSLEIGDKFLFGRNVIDQKQHKEVGDPITFYIVTGKTNGGIVYMPQYEILQEDRKDGIN